MRDINQREVSAAINRAISFLRAAQLPHGEFRTLVRPGFEITRAIMEQTTFDSSPFATSFVVYALSHARRGDVGDIMARAVRFLRSEMELGGVWRYWSKRQHKHFRLPPDLDDTACISFALLAAAEPAPRNSWAFHAARDASGRFLTWLSPSTVRSISIAGRFCFFAAAQNARAFEKKNRPPENEDPRFIEPPFVLDDVDPVVNANVVLYLRERSETAAAIEFLRQVILVGVKGDFSRYYQEPAFLFHAVARAYRHSAPSLASLGPHVVEGVSAGLDSNGRYGNALLAAASMSALLTYDPDSELLHNALDQILASQREDGGWDAFAFYLFWGSEELTTAFCLEALCRFQQRLRHH